MLLEQSDLKQKTNTSFHLLLKSIIADEIRINVIKKYLFDKLTCW